MGSQRRRKMRVARYIMAAKTPEAQKVRSERVAKALARPWDNDQTGIGFKA